MSEAIPKISIIIPTWNSAATLSKTIDSILSQTFSDVEILIIDGVSTDNTFEIAKSYNDNRLKIFSEKDNGIYDAMNKGIRLAKGEWIYFLGSDDSLYDKQVLEKVSQHLIGDVVYANVFFKCTTDKRKNNLVYDGKFNKFKLSLDNICHQAIFFKREIFDKLGYYEIKYKIFADWHFNMIWFNDNTIQHKFVDMIVAEYSAEGASATKKDFVFQQDYFRLVQKHFPFYIYCYVRLYRILKFIYRHTVKKFIRKS